MNDFISLKDDCMIFLPDIGDHLSIRRRISCIGIMPEIVLLVCSLDLIFSELIDGKIIGSRIIMVIL